MIRKNESDERLRALLKVEGLHKSDEQANARLKHIITTAYRKHESASLTRNQWPARVIFVLAIISCGLLLYRVNSILLYPVVLMVLGLTTGLWAVIFLFATVKAPKIQS